VKRLLPVVLICSTIFASALPSWAGRISFKKGQTATTVTGRVGVKTGANTYSFKARKGQKLNLKLLADRNGLIISNIYAYCGEEYAEKILASDVTSWSGRLPCDDEYSLDIYYREDRSSAKRQLPENYRLQISIK
jgi:hypothetical protein